LQELGAVASRAYYVGVQSKVRIGYHDY